MSVREARESDAEALARVHERCWRISYEGIADAAWITERPLAERVEEWRGFCRGEGLPMWVAEHEGEPVGFVAAGASRDDGDGPEVGEIAALYVAPEHQRHGHGHALLARAQESMRAAGHTRAVLWTLEANPASRSFYEAHGWRLEGATREEGPQCTTCIRYARGL